eukprot:3012066-Lingulodinium_polyedra.AAC.1
MEIPMMPLEKFMIDPSMSELSMFPSEISKQEIQGRALRRKSSNDKSLEYKVDHLQAFMANGLSWPPGFPAEFADKVSYLPPRMQER